MRVNPTYRRSVILRASFNNFTAAVYSGEAQATQYIAMKRQPAVERLEMKVPRTSAVRSWITFPAIVYEHPNIAKQKKVSLALMVREAAERYLADQTADGAGRVNPR